LTRALAKIFGSSITASLAQDRLSKDATSVIETPPDDGTTPAGAGVTAVTNQTVTSLVAEMRTHWDAADKALRAGDFATYGAEMKKARDVLERLDKIKKN
jgi:hypothetical protein